MKIIVLNASPKGNNSVTFQSILYLEKLFSEHTYCHHHVGQTINAISKKPEKLSLILDEIETCDAVLWTYPVYTFMVPYQLVKFIDLVKKSGRLSIFEKKYTSQISTSKHFYDHTAYTYLHNICEDWGMFHVPGLTADMDDLTKKKGRQQLADFAEALFSTIENIKPVSKKFSPINDNVRFYHTPKALQNQKIKKQNKIVLVTDCSEEDHNLNNMIQTFRKCLPVDLQIFNIGDFNFQGGCLGCFQCAFDGSCVYTDGFDKKHREMVLDADCMILAASIDHHWFNPVWKCYDDRQFYNGHRTSMMGKSIGYIISGNLRNEPNLREILEARSEVGHLFLLDIVTDEYSTDQEITDLLSGLADKTMWAIENKPQRPQNFLGIGGMKVFRDLIYIMKGLMQEDHRFYKSHGLYDFPQKQIGRILFMQFIGLMISTSKNRKRMALSMNKYLLKPYQDIIKKL